MNRETQQTRNRLRQALMGLLREKEYDDIQIAELIERGDVALSTFYRHYANKLDLLEDVIQHLPEFVDAILFSSRIQMIDLLDPDGLRPILPIFQFVEAEIDFIRNLLQAPQGHLIFTKILEAMIKKVAETTPEWSIQEVEFLASCILGNIYHWVLLKKSYNAQEIASKLHWLTTYGLLLQRADFKDIQDSVREKIALQ